MDTQIWIGTYISSFRNNKIESKRELTIYFVLIYICMTESARIRVLDRLEVALCATLDRCAGLLIIAHLIDRSRGSTPEPRHTAPNDAKTLPMVAKSMQTPYKSSPKYLHMNIKSDKWNFEFQNLVLDQSLYVYTCVILKSRLSCLHSQRATYNRD